jgi:uncharacterized RDD family membrane protein YckC
MPASRDNLLIIQTPEGVFFPLILSGPITRFLAWFIDWACMTTLSIFLSGILGAFRIVSWDIATAVGIVCFFLIQIGYPIFTEWRWRGQTIGKRILKMRVMDAEGLHLQFSQIAIRNLLRFVDFLPAFYCLGGIFCFFSKKFQRLGDFAANTIVVRNPEIQEPDAAQVRSGKYNSFRDYPHLVARLRQHVSPKEAGIALQALLRRDQLDPSARLDLFRDVASHFKQRAQFPQEATDGLTDEQYVRNVVEMLFL